MTYEATANMNIVCWPAERKMGGAGHSETPVRINQLKYCFVPADRYHASYSISVDKHSVRPAEKMAPTYQATRCHLSFNDAVIYTWWLHYKLEGSHSKLQRVHNGSRVHPAIWATSSGRGPLTEVKRLGHKATTRIQFFFLLALQPIVGLYFAAL
jgi:hypothetical protein